MESQKTGKKEAKAVTYLIEQYPDTKDQFVNALYKKWRNKKKKLEKIQENEQKR